MKLQLNTTDKTITIEEKVNIGELVDTLKRLLPNDTWLEFSIEVHIINNWSNPIIFPIAQPYIPYNPFPYTPTTQQPFIWCNTNDTTSAVSLNMGVYNVLTERANG